MTTDPHELAALYALDALDMAEQDQFQEHLAQCPACQAEVAQLRTATTALAEASAAPVPPGLRHRVLTEVGRTPQVRGDPGTRGQGPAPVIALDRHRSRRGGRGRRRAGPGRLLSLAAAVALVVAATVATAAVLSQREGQAPDQVAAAVRAAPDAQTLTLDRNFATGSVEVVWSQNRDQVVVEAGGLSDPGPGRRYQLWRFDGDGGVVPSELFAPDDAGAAVLVAPLDGDPAGWAVTIEPASGSAQPTGQILYSAER